MKSQRASKSKSDRPAVLLSPSEPADPECQAQFAIAHRTPELFEVRDRQQGHDVDAQMSAILDRVLQELGRRPPDYMELL